VAFSDALAALSPVYQLGAETTFDGVSDFVQVPYAAWMNAPHFTVVAAVNRAADGAWGYAVTRSSVFDLSITDSNDVFFHGSFGYSVEGGAVPAGTLTLVGGSFDGTFRAWVGGVEAGSGSGSIGTGTDDLFIGTYDAGDTDKFAGSMLDVAFFDRALTGSEWATLQASLADTGPAPVGTDLTYGNYGYGYTGETDLIWSPPAATPPLGAFPAATPMQRIHHVPPALTFDNGRPVFAGFGSEVVEPWVDYLRVTVGGRDVTWFRDFQTVVGGWQNLDPYGDASLSLSFPAIGEFEAPGVGDLAWLKKTSRVVLNRVVGGVVVDAQDPLFDGIVARDSLNSGPASISCDGAYMGRQSRLLHQPYIMHNPARTLVDHLTREHRKIYRADFQIVSNVAGPSIRSRGDRSMTRVGYVDHLLGLSNQEDGDSYTLLPDRSVARNAMRLQLRSMATVDATVYAGAHGVKVNDFAADPSTNRVYIEGQGPDGGRYRNAVFPNAGYDDDAPPYPFSGSVGVGESGAGVQLLTRRLWSLGLLDSDDAGSLDFDDEVEAAVNDFREGLGLPQNGTVTSGLWGNLYRQGFNQQSLQGVHFEPGAAKTETVQWLRGPGGDVVGKNPNYDRKVMPVEEFVSYGENVYKRGAKKNAKATIGRTEVRTGTVVLTSDPAEMSRFEMRAGMTLLVKNLMGTGAAGLKVYVSSVEVDWSGQSVTLAVATSALHFIELATIRQRQVEARQNPAKRARQAFRHSGQTRDTVMGWESEGPSGVIPRRMIQAGQWNPLQVVAAERGNLAEARFVADNPTAFQVIVLGQQVSPKVLNRKVGNPFHMRGGEGSRVVVDGVTTKGSKTVTSAAANFTAGDVGRTITGPGIGTSGTIDSVTNSSTVVISHEADDTATGVHLTIGASADFDQFNTFEFHADWLQNRLLAQAYGDPDQPGGYYPKKHTNEAGKKTTAPVTGVLFDDGSQPFVTRACFLWVYVWPLADTMFHGRLKLEPEE